MKQRDTAVARRRGQRRWRMAQRCVACSIYFDDVNAATASPVGFTDCVDKFSSKQGAPAGHRQAENTGRGAELDF